MFYFNLDKFIWNIWVRLKGGTRIKFPSEIFGCEKNERQSSEIPIASFQLASTYSAMVDHFVLSRVFNNVSKS